MTEARLACPRAFFLLQKVRHQRRNRDRSPEQIALAVLDADLTEPCELALPLYALGDQAHA